RWSRRSVGSMVASPNGWCWARWLPGTSSRSSTSSFVWCSGIRSRSSKPATSRSPTHGPRTSTGCWTPASDRRPVTAAEADPRLTRLVSSALPAGPRWHVYDRRLRSPMNLVLDEVDDAWSAVRVELAERLVLKVVAELSLRDGDNELAARCLLGAVVG